MRRIGRAVKWLILGLVGIVAIVFAVRTWEALNDPTLGPWHTYVPDEAIAEEIDAMDWAAWLAREDALLEGVRVHVTDELAPKDRALENRYDIDSPMYAPRFAVNWNRSFTLMPDGPPRGAVVLVHGLTDSPFSVRHLAELYRDLGFAVVAPRMPGHGTVPGGLTAAVWPQWLAAVRLAVREGAALAGPDAPLHLVGYSNGGALVVKYALDALEDPALTRPDHLTLLSPMIGVTAFAAFAGLAGWPAALPGLVRAAWLDIIPEFNPFKYNSFPVEAAVQSHRLTMVVRADLERASRDGRIAGMPPVLAFQSVVDATVSAQAVVVDLFERLPANGSELVLFDLNRAAELAPLIRRAANGALDRILPPPPRRYGVSVVTNAGPRDYAAVALVTPASATEAETLPLGLAYPRDVYSLSHVALPFPLEDGLYGLMPDPADDFGVNIGTLAARGESGVISVGADMFARLYSNPFYPLLAQRVAAAVPDPAP